MPRARPALVALVVFGLAAAAGIVWWQVQRPRDTPSPPVTTRVAPDAAPAPLPPTPPPAPEVVEPAPQDAAVDAADDPEAMVTGRVRWPDGSAAAGVTVWATTVHRRTQITTDAEGRFSLGPFVDCPVAVMAVGCAGMAETHVNVCRRTARPEPVLTLPRGAAIAGRVVTSDGAPVAGVDVFASPERRPRYVQPEACVRPARTGEDGRFALEGRAQAPHTLTARANQRPTVELEGVRPGGAEVELVLLAGAELAGRVVARDGNTVPFAIALVRRDGPALGDPPAVTGGDDGAFLVKGVPAGVYDVVATSGAGGAVERGVALADGQRREGLTLVVGGQKAVTGRLVGFASHRPLVGVRLALRWGTKEALHATSGPAGEFRFAGAPDAGAATLEIEQGQPGVLAATSVVQLGTPGDPVALGDVRVVETTEADEGAGKQAGIGAQVRERDGRIVIEALLPGSPASRAGLAPGDVVVSVDGHDPAGLGLPAVVHLLRGRASTPVRLVVRGPGGNTRSLTIERAGL